MRAILFCNGDIKNYSFYDKYIQEYDICICCDGGLRHCVKMDIFPDFIVGDFDSVDSNLLEKYVLLGSNVVKFPVKKNFTDCEAGIDIAIEKGASNIVIFGAVGSRIDHTITNVHILKKPLFKGIDAEIINEQNKIRLTNDNANIEGMPGDTVSLIPLTTSVHGVTTFCLEYPLLNATLNVGETLGISNKLVEKVGKVSVKDGVLIIIIASD